MPQHDSKVQYQLDRLRETGRKVTDVPCVYPLQEPQFGNGVSETDIASLEGILKAPLPHDFLLFQRLCGSISAMDIWNGYALRDAQNIRALIVAADPPIVSIQGEPRVIPIGGDGGGNMFLLTLVGNGPVLKWHHETGRQEYLAASFVLFLERLAEDWEHFVRSDGKWPYMAG